MHTRMNCPSKIGQLIAQRTIKLTDIGLNERPAGFARVAAFDISRSPLSPRADVASEAHFANGSRLEPLTLRYRHVTASWLADPLEASEMSR